MQAPSSDEEGHSAYSVLRIPAKPTVIGVLTGYGIRNTHYGPHQPLRPMSKLPPLRLGDDLLRDRARNLLVMARLHAVGSAPLGHRAHHRRVAEHLREWHLRPDHLR